MSNIEQEFIKYKHDLIKKKQDERTAEFLQAP